MSEDKLRDAVNRASRAQQIMQDELMIEAFANEEAAYISAWKATPVRDTDARERLWQAVQVVGKVKSHFEMMLTNGKLAQREIQDLATMGERRKIFGVV